MSKDYEPTITAFLCNWCTFTAADLAGTSRLDYPANVKIIRMMCSGMVDPKYVLKAFMEGTDGVFIGGCWPGDCHYINGNLKARRRVALLHEVLGRFGVERDRLWLRWVAASEGNMFAETVQEMTARLQELGPFSSKQRETRVMSYHELSTADGLNAALATLLGDLIRKGVVCSVMAPTRQPHKGVVMQSLITDATALEAVDPFAPVATSNAAKQVAALTHHSAGRPIAVVLRSCEVRALIELAKLHQATLDDLLIIGIDCFGRYENSAYQSLIGQQEDLTAGFIQRASKGDPSTNGVEITAACQICEHPVANAVDLRLCVIGADVTERIWVEALTPKGDDAVQAVGLDGQENAPEGREAAVQALVKTREAAKAELFERFTAETLNTLAGLEEAVAGCINCYNCRVAWPVCYCRECVFLTDTFRHDGEQHVAWAAKRGQLKLPTDTTFYHLTRMVHMSALCVGCGQCSSACPNDLPIMELFRTVAEATQRRFEYLPGMALDEPQPLAVFYDGEFGDVTGQTK